MKVEGVKLVTVSWDENNGLEVDWDGMNEYEAYGYLSWAVDAVTEHIVGTDEDEDVDE